MRPRSGVLLDSVPFSNSADKNYLPLEVGLGQAYHTFLVPIVFSQVVLVALDCPSTQATMNEVKNLGRCGGETEVAMYLAQGAKERRPYGP